MSNEHFNSQIQRTLSGPDGEILEKVEQEMQQLRKEGKITFPFKLMLQEDTAVRCISYHFSLTWKLATELYQYVKTEYPQYQTVLHKQLDVAVRIILLTSYLHHYFGLLNESK